MSKLLTDVEAAKELRLSPYTLRNWRVQGRGPRWVMLGRAVRYRPEDLQEYCEKHRVAEQAVR